MNKQKVYDVVLVLVLLVVFIILMIVNNDNAKKEVTEEVQTTTEEVEVASISKPIIDLQITLTPEIEEPIDYVSEYGKKLDLIDSYDEQEWFVAYKLLQDEYSEYIERNTTIYEKFSSSQITYMQRCIETEVYQAPFDSKCNVASVILNRVASNRWSNDPTIVITSKNQFSYFRTDITESTILALEYAYRISDTTNGCVAFRSGNKPSSWIGLNLQFIDEVGHGFYK